MGLFSIYTGLLYNECFSFPLNLFGSHWTANFTERTVLGNKFLQLNPETQFSTSAYPFGFDPVWKVSSPSPNVEVLLIASYVLVLSTEGTSAYSIICQKSGLYQVPFSHCFPPYGFSAQLNCVRAKVI
jgi:hypothetical protein